MVNEESTMYEFMFALYDIEDTPLEQEPFVVRADSIAEAWILVAARIVRLDNPECSTVRCLGADEVRGG